MRYTFFNTSILTLALALICGACGASGWTSPPHKLSMSDSPHPDHLVHLQIDNEQHGLAIHQTGERSFKIDIIRSDGSVSKTFTIDGKYEGALVNPSFDMVAISLKNTGTKPAQTQWHISTDGQAWSESQVGTRYIPFDTLPDGTQLVVDRSTNTPVFELRAPGGKAQHTLTMDGARLPSGDDDAGPALDRFALLRDGSGFIQRGATTSLANGKKQSTLITRLWDGHNAVTVVPDGVRRFEGFDPSRVYIQTDDDRLLVAAAGHKPVPVDMHGQSVRTLQWAADGTLQMLHGNAAFNAETRLGADGRVVSQWVRPKGRLAAGLANSELTERLSDMAASGQLHGQAVWSGQRFTSYLSDPYPPYDTHNAIVVSLDGENNFAPQAYAWPDNAAYSPDMQWMLAAKPNGGYVITPAKPLSYNKALAILKRLAPPSPLP